MVINSVIIFIINFRIRNFILRSVIFSCFGKKCLIVKYMKKRVCDDVMCNFKNLLVRYGSEFLVIDDDIDKIGF